MHKLAKLAGVAVLFSSSLSLGAFSQELTVDMNAVSDTAIGDRVGTVVIKPEGSGVALAVELTGIPPGEHGFHVHEKGSCSAALKDGKPVAALAAGPHYDPDGHKSHKGPTGEGHRGDLPLLTATDKGVSVAILAPRLKLADLAGRALVVHASGDNYSDQPENGGGMARIACGVIPQK